MAGRILQGFVDRPVLASLTGRADLKLSLQHYRTFVLGSNECCASNKKPQNAYT